MKNSSISAYPKATIVNSGWLLANLPDQGYGHAKEYYIGYAHDLSSKSITDRLGFPVTVGVLLLALISACIVNLFVYVRRGVKRDFLILASILHVRSILFAATMFFCYVAPAQTGGWELPDWTCKLVFVVSWVTGIYGTNIESLISYERRLCISSNTINYKSNTFKILAIAFAQLFMCILMSLAFLWWPFNTVMVKTLIVEGYNDNQPIALCTQWDLNFVNDFDTSFLMIVYYFSNYSFAIPFLGYNYWKAFKSIAALRNHGSQSSSQIGSAQSMNPKNPLNIVPEWKRREIYLFKLSVLIFIVFVLSFMPAFWSTFALATWRIGGYQIEVAWIRKFSLCVVISGSLVSAILQSITPSHLEIWFDKVDELWDHWRRKLSARLGNPNRISTIA